MNMKSLISLVLLLFIMTSIIYVTMQDVEPDSTKDSPINEQAVQYDITDGEILTVYYFHGNRRCNKCNKLERYSHQAIQDGFGGALTSGRLRWQVLNYEDPTNKSYTQKFELVAPSVIVTNTIGDSTISWSNLDQIWELIDDSVFFSLYIQRGIQPYLGDT